MRASTRAASDAPLPDVPGLDVGPIDARVGADVADHRRRLLAGLRQGRLDGGRTRRIGGHGRGRIVRRAHPHQGRRDAPPPRREVGGQARLFCCQGCAAAAEWIAQAKKPETRARRVLDTATLAADNKRANQWPRQA